MIPSIARYDFNIPTHTVFGCGSLSKLHEQKLPGRKALVVISCGKSTRANGYLDRTIAELEHAGVQVSVFDKVQPNPLKDTVMEGAEAARDCEADFIVALGGGSVMDAAKAMAMMATNPGDLWDYVMFGTGGRKPAENAPLPLVAITTTAGTGSETDSGGVITNPDTHEKTAVFDGHRLMPVLAIVDPELMVSVPPAFTAYQGFDALFHSTEGYMSKTANYMSDLVALGAIENIGRYLPVAVNDGKNMEAREHVAYANWLSGLQMEFNGCTSEHSLEHALSAYHQELPHGAGLIMISMAYYRHFVQAGCCPERFVRMAKALGKADAACAEDFLTALADVLKACGVDELKMSDYGITPDEFPAMADNAVSAMGFLFANDPAPLSREDCIKIYTESYR
ncbi:MAG: iron-containing alcohol dehydrogenase [Akkermansia sp.]|nr:iron-containing alcohol dehydrogenase [Akkermansia sp.]